MKGFRISGWTLLKAGVVAVVLGYLCFVFLNFAGRRLPVTCKGVEVHIADSTRSGFITQGEVIRLLDEAGLSLPGRSLDDINSREVADSLGRNPFIKEATCYKSPGGVFHIVVSQRLPILRVMTADAGDYYLDEQGNAMNSMGYSANLPVVTGHVTREFAKQSLVKLGLYLRSHPFWNEQITQADVDKDGGITIVPRVGAQTIHLGSAEELDVKFGNLMTFYRRVMPTVGWNKYAHLDVEHTNQIICTKTKKGI